MKKVTVQWTEFHNYETVIEVPDNLTKDEEIDWAMNNTDEWDMHLRRPYEINTDWDSFYVEDLA